VGGLPRLIDVRGPKRANEIVDTAVEFAGTGKQLGPGAARAIYRVHECVPPLPGNCPAGKYPADKRIWRNRAKRWKCFATVPAHCLISAKVGPVDGRLWRGQRRWKFFFVAFNFPRGDPSIQADGQYHSKQTAPWIICAFE